MTGVQLDDVNGVEKADDHENLPNGISTEYGTLPHFKPSHHQT